jgi:hypothetical protein
VVSWQESDQSLDACRRFLRDLKGRLTGVPLFMTDELGHYETVLWEEYHPSTGRRPKELPSRDQRASEVSPELDYARVVKERKHHYVSKVDWEVIYGAAGRVETRLNGGHINTAYVERFNQTLRLHNRNLARKSPCFSKSMTDFRARIDLFMAFYNLVRPHSSLRLNQDGVRTMLTPAQHAGISSHRWTIQDLLSRPSIH